MRLILIIVLSLFYSQQAIATPSATLFLGSREGDPASLVKNVSTINGDYSEIETDLVVSGPDLLILSRFYTSQDTLDIASFGAWRFQPQTFFLICGDPKQGGYQTPQGIFEGLNIFIGTPEGSLLKFSGFQNWDNPEVHSEFRIYLEEDESGICNTARGCPSSWANPKHHILYYHPQSQSFELQLSSGGKRVYTQSQSARQFHLKEEILPTGNRISYEYDTELRLKQIKMTNVQGTKTFSWIAFDYGASILATASDGTSAEYHLEKDPSGAYLLLQVQKTSTPLCTYHYQIEGRRALLIRKEYPNERYIDIQYERASPYRAQTLSIPTSDGISQTHFNYEEGVTHVQFPLERQTLYTYNEEKRLTSIEDSLGNVPYRTLKKIWGERKDQGNLIAEALEDHSGNTLYYKTFSYDLVGNILEETEYGNLTGENKESITFNRRGKPEEEGECHTKAFTYTNTADEDIISQINENGNGTLTVYQRGTSIPKRKEIYQDKQAKRQIFYDYNEEGTITRITIDNGNTRDRNDVDYISQKRITIITPKTDLPNLGAPEVIEERYYDHDSRSENLLKKTINHFDSRGFVIKQEIFDRNGALSYTIEKDYDDAGRCTTYIDPLGNQINYTYDANGNLIQKETQDLTTDYNYDIQNNLTSITHFRKSASPQKTTLAYNQIGQPILEVDPLGNETHHSYDPYGRLIQKTTIEQTSVDATWTYSYNLFDHPVTITDPLNNATAIEYNTRGRPTHIASDGKKESFVYSLEGSLIHHTTSQGITKTFEYDYLGRPITVHYYERESNENYKTDLYYYDAFHLLSESTSNGQIKYIYNSQGQLIQSTFAQNDSSVWWSTGISKIENGEVTDFAYDAQGRLIETKKWKDKRRYTLYAQQYDSLGHVTEERVEDEQGKLLYKKQFTYTPTGQLLSEIGFPNNQETVLAEYTYDAFGRFAQVKRGNSIWDITHEEGQGLLKKTIRDPLGSITKESYNREGLLLSRIQKDPKYSSLLDEQFTYDALNNLSGEKASNFEISYEHTPSALCQSIALIHNTPSSFWKASEKQETLQRSFSYNSYGELKHSNVPSFEKEVEYTYDHQGNLSHITYQEAPNGQTRRYTLTSDKQGNTAKIVQDDGFTLEKTYNRHGRILTEKMKDKWGVYGISYKYDGEICLTQITLPDQSSIQYTYEGPFVSKIKRLSKENAELYTYEVTDRDLMGNVLQEILPKNLGVRKNTYDFQGRKVEVVSDFLSDRIAFDSLGNPVEKITKKGQEETKTLFTYDSLSQLITENDHSHQYDSLQNLVHKDNTPYTTPYNQVAKAGNCSCEYDENGNLKSLSDSSGTMKLQFDSLGRLVLTQTPDEKTIHYTYDSDLRRMSKSTDHDDHERYFYLGGYELGAMDERGNIKTLRIPINPNSLDSTSILSVELENEIYIPFTDLQRNIRCLVNPQRRNIVESYNFSPFGEEEVFTPRRQVAQSQLNNPWRFQSKRHDNETRLIYYGARYYNPKLCKWISPDPIGSHDSLNLYLFCRNNPLKYYDPWGLASKEKQNCQCGYCIRGEGWCHCRGEDRKGDISKCACRGIACVCGQRGILSGVAIAVSDFAVDTWNNPRFQGGLQAFGGITEAVIGGGMAIGSGGLAAPVGGLVTAHGLDHFFTGMQTAFSGSPRDNVTIQLLQKTGMSLQTASLVDGGLSTAGSLGGIAVIRARQLAAFPNYRLPVSSNNSRIYVNRETSFAGSKRTPLNYAPYQKFRNESIIINGRKYTGHALDRMQDRGFMPSVIENAISESQAFPGNFVGTLEHYDVVNKVRIIVGESGQVITIIPGRG